VRIVLRLTDVTVYKPKCKRHFITPYLYNQADAVCMTYRMLPFPMTLNDPKFRF